MELRSSKNRHRGASPLQPHVHLVISEIQITEKRALRKRHHDYLYQSFKTRYSSRGKNEILC